MKCALVQNIILHIYSSWQGPNPQIHTVMCPPISRSLHQNVLLERKRVRLAISLKTCVLESWLLIGSCFPLPSHQFSVYSKTNSHGDCKQMNFRLYTLIHEQDNKSKYSCAESMHIACLNSMPEITNCELKTWGEDKRKKCESTLKYVSMNTSVLLWNVTTQNSLWMNYGWHSIYLLTKTHVAS